MTALDRLARAAEAVAAAAARLAAALGAVAVLACFALVCYSVGLRYLLNSPLGWSDEVTGWLVVAVVMLAAAETQRRGENIGVDLVLERTRGRVRRALVVLGFAAVAASALLVLVKGIETVRFAHMVGLKSITLAWADLWPVQALVPVGAALMLLVALAQLLSVVAGRAPHDAAAEPPAKSHK